MSRFILLAGAAGLCAAGCSSPAEEGEPEDPPSMPPPGFLNGTLGQGGASGQQVGQAGTGGTGVLPTAGTGGAPAASAGTGGAPVAAAGAGGTGGAPSTIPTGTGNLIMHDAMGWVAGATNGPGIQGSFYPFGDADAGGDTTIALGDFATSPTSTCASGSASQVLMELFGTYWGGGIGLNLADPGGGQEPGAWSPGTVTGFSFTISGTTIPTALRFNAIGADGVTRCGNLVAGANTVILTSLTVECYETPPGAQLAAGTALEAIQWQVVTNAAAATPFNFCIDNLTVLGGS